MKLLSGGIKRIVQMPMYLLRSVLRFQRYRSTTELVFSEAGGEIKELSGTRRFFRGVAIVLLYILFIAALVGAFYGLWLLNQRWDLERQLGGPLPLLRRVWLPLLFALFVAACLAGLWVWRLLGPLGEPTDYPDIYQAWLEARAAIEEAGIPLTDVPLYLVIGRPAGGLASFFAASHLAFPVRGVPGRGDAPIQVFAGAQGVFVTCPGASLLARLAVLLAEGEAEGGARLAAARTVFDESGEAPAGRALTPAAAGPLLLPDEGPSGAAPAAVARTRRGPQLLQNSEEVERARLRLRYLGRLLAHNRQPYCGANGIVLLVPFASTDDDAATYQAAGACRLDLAAARDGLQTECPSVVDVCDLETAPGAGEFLHIIPDDRKDRLLGQPFPLAPDVPAEKLPPSIEDGLRWAGGALERLVVRSLKASEVTEAGLRGNADLYQFLAAVRTRESRLAHIFGKAATTADGRPSRFGGGFLSATGPDPTKDQAFVAALFRLLADYQNYVTWTSEAKAEDAAYQSWAMIGYLGIGLFIVGVGLACYWQFRG
jgi:hypothetical protein